MRWNTTAAAAAFGGLVALLAPGCGSDPPAASADGSCGTSGACTGSFPFCVDGRCQECVADQDCRAGFVCRTNRCVPRPQCVKDADCPPTLVCRDDRCVVKPP